MGKTRRGVCKLCKEEKELTFEHIPPQSAFNRETRFYSISQKEYFKDLEGYVFKNRKPKVKKQQGGYGSYCLCKDCNGFLGSKYVRDYKKFSHLAMSVLQNNPDDAKAFEMGIPGINLLHFLKQVTAIFICMNDHTFTDTYSELLEFVKEPDSEKLDRRYQFYMYLNEEGQARDGILAYTNLHGAICDFSFRPFGFVLSIDNPNRLMAVSEITGFNLYHQITNKEDVKLVLNKHPTYYPFPLDFRPKEELLGK